MQKRLSLLIILLLCTFSLQGRLLMRGIDLMDTDLIPKASVEQHFAWGMDCFRQQSWESAEKNFAVVTHNFPRSHLTPESYYRQAVSNYCMGEYDTANDLLSKYLRSQGSPQFFTRAIDLKFRIAERMRCGYGRRAYGSKRLPKVGGELLGIEIYDEIIAMVPSDELACQSFFCKAILLHKIEMYRDAVVSLQSLIRRFPKHELTPQSYQMIGEIFRDQAKIERQNSDILEMARLNYKHFEENFPKESRLIEAKATLETIEESYAESLFEIASVYQRKGESTAASIYYLSAIEQFPETHIASRSHRCLKELSPELYHEKFNSP